MIQRPLCPNTYKERKNVGPDDWFENYFSQIFEISDAANAFIIDYCCFSEVTVT